MFTETGTRPFYKIDYKLIVAYITAWLDNFAVLSQKHLQKVLFTTHQLLRLKNIYLKSCILYYNYNYSTPSSKQIKEMSSS